jgi:hypothetical protein
MEEKQISKEQKVEEKKTYTPPTLTVYGKLADLTASGSLNQGESSTSMPPRVGSGYMS